MSKGKKHEIKEPKSMMIKEYGKAVAIKKIAKMLKSKRSK